MVVVIAFSVKLKVSSRENSTTHFAKLATTAQLMMSTEKYTNMIFVLDNEFGRRVANFQKLGSEYWVIINRLKPSLKKKTAGTD